MKYQWMLKIIANKCLERLSGNFHEIPDVIEFMKNNRMSITETLEEFQKIFMTQI